MTEETKTEKDIQELIDLAFSAVVQTSVELEDDQLDALENLNQYCVNTALHNPEVIKKPLKVVYKTNEGLKEALVAICLAYSLVNPRRKLRENKEFFDKNITIYQRPGNVKFIDFGEIAPDSVQAAVYWDIIEDWKLYIDRECGGIKALVDEKTNLAGLDNYIRGGDPLYEFARFHRKYTEKTKLQEEKSKISAQDAFRNAVVQSVATEVTKQQLLAGKNPMEIIDSLLNQAASYRPEIERRPPEQRQIGYRNRERRSTAAGGTITGRTKIKPREMRWQRSSSIPPLFYMPPQHLSRVSSFLPRPPEITTHQPKGCCRFCKSARKPCIL